MQCVMVVHVHCLHTHTRNLLIYFCLLTDGAVLTHTAIGSHILYVQCMSTYVCECCVDVVLRLQLCRMGTGEHVGGC